MTARPQLDALTGARGIAAWYVVFYHIREAFDDSVPPSLIAFLSKGYLAVDLFFILSGFVMWLNYGDKFSRDGLKAAPDFLRRRLARIYPLHFVVLSAMLGFDLLLMATGRGDAARYPLTELPLHYALIQNWGFTHALSWNDPAWSISTELAAYLALPFVGIVITRTRNVAWINIAFIGLFCAGLSLFFAWKGAVGLGNNITGNGVFRCLCEFLSGVFVCRLWQRRSFGIDAIAVITLIATALLWAVNGASEVATVPALFAAIVYLIARTSSLRGNPLSSRPLVHLGDISYSTYLAHFFLWTVYKLIFVTDPSTVALPLMLGFLAATYGASELLYRLVEKPGRTWVQALAFWQKRPLAA